MKNCKYLVLEEQLVSILFVSEFLFVTISTAYVIIHGCAHEVKLLLYMS